MLLCRPAPQEAVWGCHWGCGVGGPLYLHAVEGGLAVPQLAGQLVPLCRQLGDAA